MENKKYKINCDSSKSVFIINNDLSSIFAEINYIDDVDFTDFVEKLSYNIDAEIKIELDSVSVNIESLSPKEKIIYETITQIINSYNKSYVVTPKR